MNIESYKAQLEEELETVMNELAELGHEDIDETATEPDELADRMEEMEAHGGETTALLERKKEIAAALERIAGGTYGFCEECGEKVEEDRLEANLAAATCSMHMA